MSLLLIALDSALPVLQSYLSARGDTPLDPAEAQVAAELLETYVRKGEALVAFALYLGGRPCRE